LNKEIESRALLAAHRAGFPLPSGEIIPGEEPDFRIATETGTLGIELTEVLPPPRNESFRSPVAEEDLHKSAVEIAEKDYSMAGGLPLKVRAYFWDIERGRNKKREMAQRLACFVKSHCSEATPVATFTRRDKLPEGFGVISIDSNPGPWWGGESVGNTLEGIYQQLAARIAAKNKLVPTYRKNLPPGTEVWLLLYSTAAVSRSIPVPRGIDEWEFHFDFDRVYWFSCLEGQFVEIRRAESAVHVAI